MVNILPENFRKIAYYDVFMVKLDSDGNQLWEKKFGGFGPEAIYSAQQTNDGGFILGGYQMAGSKCDVLLMKTDLNGNVPCNYNKNIINYQFFYLFSKLLYLFKNILF